MNFEKTLEFAKTNQHAQSMLQGVVLSSEQIADLKKLLHAYWLDNQTEEQKRQMIFAGEVLLGHKEAVLTTEDYAIIELVSKEEFFDEAWASVIHL